VKAQFVVSKQLPIAQGPFLAVESYWDTRVLQPMPYLYSLALKAARNLLRKTFFTTQEYPSKGIIF